MNSLKPLIACLWKPRLIGWFTGHSDVVIHTQSKQTDDSFTDWNWWAIRGNDTGDIITASNFARFQKTFQDTLFSAGESMDGKTGYIVKAVEMAFGEAPQYMVNYPGTSSQAS